MWKRLREVKNKVYLNIFYYQKMEKLVALPWKHWQPAESLYTLPNIFLTHSTFLCALLQIFFAIHVVWDKHFGMIFCHKMELLARALPTLLGITWPCQSTCSKIMKLWRWQHTLKQLLTSKAEFRMNHLVIKWPKAIFIHIINWD